MKRFVGVSTPVWSVCLGLVLAGIAACAAPIGLFSASGYAHGELPLRVAPARDGAPGAHRLMPSGWQLDNYAREHGRYVPKTTAPYVAELTVDLDGDDRPDRKASNEAYVLRFEEAKGAGVVWLRALPLARGDTERDLAVLADRLLANVAHTAVELATPDAAGQAAVRCTSTATALLGRVDAMVGGAPAHQLRFDVVSAVNLRLDANAPRTRVELALIRAPFSWQLSWKRSAAVLVVVGYSNTPKAFAAGRPAFVSLLKRLTLDGGVGYDVPEFASASAAVVARAPVAVAAVPSAAPAVSAAASPPSATTVPSSAPSSSLPPRGPNDGY